MNPFVEETPTAAWEDERLVQACLQGKSAAWEALLQKYKRLIYGIPFRYGATAEDAEDIFQNVCLELYDELPRLRNAGALRGWLVTVTSRHSLRWKQNRLRRGEQDLESAAEPAAEEEPAIETLERGQLVHEALRQLPARCQQLLELLFFEDPPRPYEQVAKALGLAIGSIGFIRGRCMEKLRKGLEEAGF